jgi:hypothetical protein
MFNPYNFFGVSSHIKLQRFLFAAFAAFFFRGEADGKAVPKRNFFMYEYSILLCKFAH